MGVRSISAAIERGDLPVVRISQRNLRVRRPDFLAWLGIKDETPADDASKGFANNIYKENPHDGGVES